jgi:hypothetical protein
LRNCRSVPQKQQKENETRSMVSHGGGRVYTISCTEKRISAAFSATFDFRIP